VRDVQSCGQGARPVTGFPGFMAHFARTFREGSLTEVIFARKFFRPDISFLTGAVGCSICVPKENVFSISRKLATPGPLPTGRTFSLIHGIERSEGLIL